MKKILILILVLSLSLSVMVGCDKLTELVPGLENILPGAHQHNYVDGVCECGEKDPTYVAPHEHNFVDGKCECGEEDPNYVPPVEEDADLKAAYDYIHQSAKEILKETGANYELPTSATIGNKNYTAEWTVTTDLITFTPHADKENVVVVNIPRVYEDVSYTLKFTIINEKGDTLSREYNHIIPAFKVASFEEYMAAKKDDVLTVKGIVVAISSKSAGAKRNHVYVADESGVGGYYNYNMVDDPATLGIKVGMTVLINGKISPSNGMQEFYQGTVEIIDETIKEVPTSDITELFAQGASLDNYVARIVTIKGVTLGNQDLSTANSQYLYFALGENKSYIRTYITDFPSTLQIVTDANGIVSSPDKDAIDALHASKFGWTADVTGILIYYSGSPYLVPVSVDCFTNLKEVERTPEEKIADSTEAVTVIDQIKEDTVLELPLVGLYEDVTISWTVDSTAVSFIEDGKLEVKLGEDEVTLTLTATFTCEGVSETKEYTILVDAASTQQYITKNTSEVKEGVAYKFGLVQGKLGETLYITGEVSGRYLVTTKYVDEAADVYVEAVENGYKFYILVEDAKQYITVYNNDEGKLSVKFDAEGTSVYAYDATVNAWVTNLDGTDYYLGTYNTFDTVSASKLSYINAENTGVSQFPCNFFELTLKETAMVNKPSVEEGVDYKFGLVQGTLGETLYITGEVSGRYLVTTKYVDEAADVYVEAVENGYKFYILVEDAKQYITVYNNDEGKLSVKFDAEGASVYAYNATVNAWVTNLDGTDYYLGTYNTFNTVSASKLSYINAENTGVSQFPCNFFRYEFVAEEPACGHANTTTTTVDATCTAAGSTTVTCVDCGATVSTTELPKLNHTYVDGECACGAKDPSLSGEVVFDFGPNGTAGSHNDGTDIGAEKTYTSGNYQLVITNASKAYDGGFDKAGNSILKFGTSSVAGTITFVVPEDVNSVIIYAARYKSYDDNNLIVINGTTYTLEGNSDEGNYTAITVDTSSNKTVVIASSTEASKPRCVINTIVFVIGDGGNTPDDGGNTPDDGGNTPDDGGNTPEGIVEMTITEALSATVGTQVKLTGTVCDIYNVWNDQYGNMSVYITDESGARIIVYRTTVVLQLGDVITVTGEIGAYNEVNQIAQGNTVTIDAPHVCSEFTDATCTDLAACVLCGKTTGSLLNHNYVDGKCECGAEEGVEAITASKTMAELITELGWTSSTTKQEFALDDVISVKVDGGNNTGKAYNGNHIRIYATDTPAGTLTISAAEGYELVSIKITTETGTYAFLYVGEGTEDICNTTVAVSGSSVVLNSVKNGSDGKQVRVLAIEVTYKAA